VPFESAPTLALEGKSSDPFVSVAVTAHVKGERQLPADVPRWSQHSAPVLMHVMQTARTTCGSPRRRRLP
jgi:hypothetical protein